MNSRNLELKVAEQSWPLDKPFRIARGISTEARVVVVTVSDGQHTGRGEAVPISRYNQNAASVISQLEKIDIKRAEGGDRQQIKKLLPAGSARNALDCALWDLEAKISGKRVWELANIQIVDAVQTALTIGLDSPEKMGAAGEARKSAPVLKLD